MVYPEPEASHMSTVQASRCRGHQCSSLAHHARSKQASIKDVAAQALVLDNSLNATTPDTSQYLPRATPYNVNKGLDVLSFLEDKGIVLGSRGNLERQLFVQRTRRILVILAH